MKKIILAIAVLFPTLLLGQSRTFNLSTFDGYTKSQLQTAGKADIDWGNLINVPDTVMSMIDSTVMLNVRDFGAVGDGVTDDRDAIYNSFVAAINNNLPIYIPFGDTFYVNSAIALQITGRKDIKILGGGTIYAPDFTGTIITLTADTSNLSQPLVKSIVRGDTLIRFDISGLDILRGDICTIFSDSSWNGSDEVFCGEIVKVRNLYGDTAISIYGSANSGYRLARIIPIKKSTFEIDGVKFIGDNSTATHSQTSMVFIKGFSAVRISNSTFADCQYSAIRIDNCDNVKLHHNYIYENSRMGFGYGAIFSGCNDVEVSNNRGDGSRHCITTGQSNTYSNPTKNISVHNNTYSNSPGFYGAIDTHHGTNYITISNNLIHSGGINIRSINTTIKDNDIYQRDGNPGIAITCFIKWLGGYFIIDGNNCIAYDTTARTSFLYYSNSTLDDVSIDDFIISNNFAEVSYQGVQIAISKNNNRIKNLTLSGNKINTHSGNMWGLDIPSLYTKIDKLLLINENYTSNQGGGIRINCDTSKYISLTNVNISVKGREALFIRYFENIIINGGYFDSDYTTKSLMSATKYLSMKNTFWNERSFNVTDYCDLSDIFGNRYHPSYDPTISSLSQVPY